MGFFQSRPIISSQYIITLGDILGGTEMNTAENRTATNFSKPLFHIRSSDIVLNWTTFHHFPSGFVLTIGILACHRSDLWNTLSDSFTMKPVIILLPCAAASISSNYLTSSPISKKPRHLRSIPRCLLLCLDP